MSLKFASNSGFVCSPVSKCLAVLVGGFHIASHIPSLHPVFRKILTGPDKITSFSSLLRCAGAKLLFLDAKNAIFCCIIIYLFRILERRYGSLKFASNLVLSSLISLTLEIVSESYLDTKSFGPLSLVMPLFVPWFLEIPVVSASHYGPVAISSKSMNYLLGVQLAMANKASAVATVCAIISGILVYCTPLKSFCLPGWLGSLFSSTIGKLVTSLPPKDTGLMGATLEIQRSQHTEALENQLIRARTMFNVPRNGGGRQLRLEEMWGGAQFGQAQHQQHQQNIPLVQSHVQALVDMGFPRERAETALRQARNNLDDATNILLQDIM